MPRTWPRELSAMGIEVILGLDLDKTGMDRKIGEFMGALTGASVGVFFYGGHGLQVGGQNYLVPVDAKLLTQRSLDFEMIRLDLVQRAMERNTKTNIIFLDACRDNPLARNLARVLGTRSSELPRGLAAVELGIGTLISFSTQPGSVALDGEGRNSPFAAALTKHLAAQELITDILINVRNDVVAATNQQQVPWEHSALRANFYFKGLKPAPVLRPTTTSANPSYDQEAELELWTAIADSKNPALFLSFVNQFPNGRFTETARIMADGLEKEQNQVKANREAEAAKREADQAMEEARKTRGGHGAPPQGGGGPVPARRRRRPAGEDDCGRPEFPGARRAEGAEARRLLFRGSRRQVGRQHAHRARRFRDARQGLALGGRGDTERARCADREQGWHLPRRGECQPQKSI